MTVGTRLRRVLALCPAFSVLSLASSLLPPRAAEPAELPFPPLTLQPQALDFSTFDLTSALPPASITLTKSIPLPLHWRSCTVEMTSMNVTFEDCGTHSPMDTVLDRFGRVPVGLRRYAGTVVVLGDSTAHAYTLTNGDTHFFGDCAMDTWVHEITHAFDFAGGLLSNSSGWNAALAADSCVPDDYSARNQVEDFAQVSVLKTYMLLHGDLPPGFESSCMQNQLNYMDSLALYNPQPMFGDTCHINDNGPPARHTQAPAVLDASRTFQTVAPETTTPPSAAATERPNSAGRPRSLVIPTVLIFLAWALS
ncbi:hypothetical protein B0H17DRAFT_1077265 [Mycena rosella]|uniref:Uncharacterized protein n=1 Tax=Mycena rosella TaxID=1033263 RepID=A0AAD7D984_MYCRO|nr:hypothetical protein B0H17DRAFT_1077265 [Mycena rosella]